MFGGMTPCVADAGSAVSAALFAEARKVMPGGNSRHTVATDHPVYAASGSGAYITDVDGNKLADFLNNYCSLILGHDVPEVRRACIEQLERGTIFGMPTASEIDLAKILVERVPGLESVRFCNSGSEAVMFAVKTARALTGRVKIAKFEGCYHGNYDYVGVSEHPDPEAAGDASAPLSVASDMGNASLRMLEDVVVLPWNDLASCEKLLKQQAGEIACCLVCPTPLTMWMTRSEKGFLEGLAQLCRSLGILYVADEVLAFSTSFHGVHAEIAPSVNPDLMALGKCIGGGLPIGAFGGRKELMEKAFGTGAGSDALLWHGGTFNANAMSMVAGAAVMRLLTPDSYAHLGVLRERLVSGLDTALSTLGIDGHIGGHGRFFVLVLGRQRPRNWRDVHALQQATGWHQAKQAWAMEMGRRGVLVSAKEPFGVLSVAMTEKEVDLFIAAAKESLVALRARGFLWAARSTAGTGTAGDPEGEKATCEPVAKKAKML